MERDENLLAELCGMLLKRNELNAKRRKYAGAVCRWRNIHRWHTDTKFARRNPIPVKWQKINKSEAYLKLKESTVLYELYKVKILRFTAKHHKRLVFLGNTLKLNQCFDASNTVKHLIARGQEDTFSMSIEQMRALYESSQVDTILLGNGVKHDNKQDS